KAGRERSSIHAPLKRCFTQSRPAKPIKHSHLEESRCLAGEPKNFVCNLCVTTTSVVTRNINTLLRETNFRVLKEQLMFRKLISTSDDYGITIARLVLGVVFFAHGAQKMLGWFGGYGFTGTMNFFTQMMHIPAVFAFLAICAEFFGGLGL